MDKLWNIETTRENKKVNYEKECYAGKHTNKGRVSAL